MKKALIVGSQPVFRMAIMDMMKRSKTFSGVSEFIEIKELNPSLLHNYGDFDVAVLCADPTDNSLVDLLARLPKVAKRGVVLFSEVRGKRHQSLLDKGLVDLCLPYSVPCSVAEHYICDALAPNQSTIGNVAMRDRSVNPRFLPDLADLSHSEQMVLLHLRDGISNQAIADRMNLQPNTVKVYLYRACRKAGFMNRTQAARTTHDMMTSGLLSSELELQATA